MKQAYFETVRSGLIPVVNVRKTETPWKYEAEVKTTMLGYTAGEVIRAHKIHFVNKARSRGPYIMVTEIKL